MRQGYDWAVDQWAFGVLLHEFATGSTPFHDDVRENVFGKIHKVCVDGSIVFPESLFARFGDDGPHLLVLITSMLAGEPSERPTWRLGDFHGVSEYDVFKGVDWDAAEKLNVPPPFVPSLDGSTAGAFQFETSSIDGWESTPANPEDTKHTFDEFSIGEIVLN